nr:retrovirus-related Pol polyprotein from transposon TNT 1-94 [Tanacetum cinerariifolium]
KDGNSARANVKQALGTRLDNSLRINRSAGYENQRIGNVAGARETVGSTVVQKCGIQCYNCKEFRHVARECQKPKRAKDAAYHRENMLLCKQEEARIQLNAEQVDWRDDTDDDELEDQELEAHCMYMAQLQEVSPDAADSRPISDDEPLQKVSNDDHYNVFSIESAHPKQSKPVHDTYPIQQDAQNVIIDSLDTSYDREEIDQNDNDDDLAKEREIEDFKNKNKSLESSNNSFKEANNRLFETNNLLSADYKKSEAELARRNSKEYASQMELECAKKEAQIKLYKTQEDKDLDKVIELENKVKVLDNIVYKTGQTVQTMNMLNNKCQTSFSKPEFLKKAQRANPRLYDIGCYNDNLALMLAPDSDEVICLEKESRSKLSDLIRPFDYDKLNNLCLNEEMVADLRYFNSLELEVDSLRSQLLQEKGIVISELKKLIEKSKGKSVDTKFEKSSGVIPTSSVSRPQLKSNPQGDRVMHNNSQGKKKAVEDQRRSVKLSKNKTSATECNDSLNAKTLNVKTVSTMCDKCVLIDEHAICVLNSVDKPIKKTVDPNPTKNLETLLGSYMSVLVRHVLVLVEIVLFIVDSVCSKHMMENLKLLINFVEKFLGTVKFRNDQIAPILGYGDLVQGAVTIKRVYYIEGLNHNLFSVDQFCDAYLEVTFRNSTCFIRDLKGNDLLTSSRGTDLYSITLQDINYPNLIYLLAKASSSQEWLWHRRLSHLNFDTINLLSKNDSVVGLPKLKFVKYHLSSSCELGKAKRKSFYTKLTPSSKRRLQLLHMDLCGPMRVASINRKRYVLVIVDDYSRYTWTHFLRAKDETPENLHAYFAAEGILHQTSVARTLEQNGVVKRRNRTLVEAARTMLRAANVPLLFWAEAIATACFTQNRSLVIPRHEKTPYHIINDQKPFVKFFHIFGSI